MPKGQGVPMFDGQTQSVAKGSAFQATSGLPLHVAAWEEPVAATYYGYLYRTVEGFPPPTIPNYGELFDALEGMTLVTNCHLHCTIQLLRRIAELTCSILPDVTAGIPSRTLCCQEFETVNRCPTAVEVC